ncbi:hypothetical protein PtA15_3A839 [Puccinia triticina]|uniref:AGC-kinase C-terminal domain-containing protein n=1 Tax=Puccinia triticina TaxID=208348 RepID=A0ABY7CE36_9BASI|nr:uncharacterized protein PtA15_3A839 [Puccinia triticina]WAQ83468.1 hypothetical protein PtA15_3A839 [Puccinia triticina]
MDTNPKTKESLRNSVDSPDDPVLDRYSESKDDSNIGQSSTENPKNTNQIGPDPKTLISQSPVVNPTSYRGVLHGKVKHLLLGVKQAVAKSEQRKGNMGDGSEDFYPLGISLSEVKSTGEGPSASVRWNEGTSQPRLNYEGGWRAGSEEDIVSPTRNIWRDDSSSKTDEKNVEQREKQMSGGFIIDVDKSHGEVEINDNPEAAIERQSFSLVTRANEELQDEFWNPFYVPPEHDANVKRMGFL